MTALRDFVRAGAVYLAVIAAMLLGLAYYLGYQDGRDSQPSCPPDVPVADVAVPVADTPDYVG